MPVLELSKCKMMYEKFGQGSKIFVCLPGLSLKSLDTYTDSVRDAFSLFYDDYTLYVFDRKLTPTHGYTVYDMADDTAEAMKKLGLSDCCVFGASQGGMIAQCIALKYPELVSKLALGSSCCRMNSVFNDVVTEWGRLARAKDTQGLNHSFVYNVYSEKTLKVLGSYFMSLNQSYTDEEFERFYTMDEASLGFDIYDKIKNIKCPVLVLGAKQDKVISVQGSYEIAEQTDAELYVYEDYGHAVYDEAPDYRQRLKDFFDK